MRLLLLALILSAIAQTQTAQSPAFEVASVKPQPFTGTGGIFMVQTRGNTLDAEHCDLKTLVEFAYNLKEFQLSGGPAWSRAAGVISNNTLYQVIAKAPQGEAPSDDRFRLMLQALLADRFQLKIHHVSKELPAYNLVQDKGGVKLKESAPGTETSMHTESWARGRGLRITAANATIQYLVEAQLGGYTGRPTFDKTGLTGSYDFRLEWIQSSDPDASMEGPSLFTGVREQLGLRLESTTAPFDTVVIDHAEKPSGN